MSEHKLVVNGSGSASGGTYEKVSVRGDANVMGAIETNKISILGTAKFHSDVSADVVSIVGEVEIQGKLKANLLKVTGKAEIRQLSNVKHYKIRGQVIANSLLSGDSIDNKGELRTDGNVTVDSFQSTGICKIEGLLSADDIVMKLHHQNSRIHEIGGNTVSVKRSKFPFARKVTLNVHQVEADIIYLEQTYADVVRGKNIIIGPGCVIKRVEYRDRLSVSSEAVVDEQVKG